MVCAAAVGGGSVSADEGENVVVPVIGYSTRSAAGSDYGVMPLADAADPNPNFGGELDWYTDDDGKTQWKTNGKGELTGVTSINGAVLQMDVNDDEFMTAIGVKSYANSYGSAFGWYARAEGQYSVAVGYAAETDRAGVALGYNAKAKADGGTSLGMDAEVGEEHTNSVAIGSYSVTNAANQVSFGHKTGDNDVESGLTYKTDLFRSLVNVADIDMHGNLTGVTGIDGVTVSGTDASTGLTVGGNAVIGKTDTPFSSTGFAVAKDGAVTAKTVNGATITGTGFNGVTLSTDGKVNGAAITSNSFNGVTLEKGADSHYKVGGVDLTKMQTDVAGKADAATTLTGYGITDAYTKTEADTAVGKKADKATTLTGYGITDAYTKTAADAKITAATADMATKTQVTADIGTAKTALESA